MSFKLNRSLPNYVIELPYDDFISIDEVIQLMCTFLYRQARANSQNEVGLIASKLTYWLKLNYVFCSYDQTWPQLLKYVHINYLYDLIQIDFR